MNGRSAEQLMVNPLIFHDRFADRITVDPPPPWPIPPVEKHIPGRTLYIDYQTVVLLDTSMAQ